VGHCEFPGGIAIRRHRASGGALMPNAGTSRRGERTDNTAPKRCATLLSSPVISTRIATATSRDESSDGSSAMTTFVRASHAAPSAPGL